MGKYSSHDAFEIFPVTTETTNGLYLYHSQKNCIYLQNRVYILYILIQKPRSNRIHRTSELMAKCSLDYSHPSKQTMYLKRITVDNNEITSFRMLGMKCEDSLFFREKHTHVIKVAVTHGFFGGNAISRIQCQHFLLIMSLLHTYTQEIHSIRIERRHMNTNITFGELWVERIVIR